MASLEVPNSVSKVTLGSDTIWQNSDGWVPMKLPSGVTGNVMFKDYGNGTAGLCGVITFKFVRISGWTPVTMLVPPDGYKFTSVDWNANDGSMGVSKSIMGFQALAGQQSQSNSVNTKIVDGNLLAVSSNYSSTTFVSTTIFTKSSTVYRSSSGEPAIIKIEKV
ncbi:hypothetical protein D8911_11420 [Levilactobacillus brevis]|nr:hypothetical protein D8911_11420 [Levilactobacillus brevis]